MSDNGKKFELNGMEFKHYIIIGYQDGKFGFKTNIGERVLGLGMLEEAKKGVELHIARLQKQNQPRISTPRMF